MQVSAWITRPLLAACLAGGLTAPARSQTALEMSVSCRLIAYADRAADGGVSFALSFDTGRCWGGFSALQQVSLFVDDRNRRALNICPPPDSTLVQMVAIFVRHVDGHPEEIQENWVRVAHRSLIAAFPCPKPPGPPTAGG
jgi:hypothetical protein